MQHFGPLITLALILLVAASCRATGDLDAPATRPSGLTASATVTNSGSTWTADVTLTNGTDHRLATGRYTSFTVTRVDAQPAQVIVGPQEQMAAPHFRVQLPVGESRKTSIVLWDKSAPLGAGKYHVAITFPRDVLPEAVVADFSVKETTTQPVKP